MTEPTPTFPTGVRTYRGSCRCGAVQFEADLDLSKGTTRCNCTMCTKSGWWGFNVAPSAFRLKAGEDRPVPNPYDGIRPHCPKCHIQPFGHANVPEVGGEFYAVNVRCLDDVDLSGAPIHYLDGKHDTWALLAESAYQDPFVGAGDRAKASYTPALLR